MKYQKFFNLLQNAGRDPSALYFEDELTQLKNRRYLLDYLEHHVDWQDLDTHPLSLLMIDTDYLRHLNQQYGQEAGDQALVHISKTLRKAAPPHALPVRYAGDEFVVALPDTPKEGARAVAENLLRQIHYNLFFSADAETPIPLTLSIGYATAPEDAATGRGLIHQADLALYAAKQSGKNQSADAASVVPETVSHKTAIHYLDTAGIVGRKSQFEVVGGALKQLGRGQRGFLIIDGAPGMGKTSFLELVQRNLEKKNVNLVHIAGVLQESYRPYYLIAYVAMALMRQLPDKGLSVLNNMDEETINRVAHIIPQLIGSHDPKPEDSAAHREAIFHAFAGFFTALLDKRPLVLLIDDMDYSDPASLYLLEALFRQQKIPMLVCGTASTETTTRPQSVPLQLFRNAYGESLDIQTIALTGLTAEGIDKHVKMIFPGIDLPRKMSRELASITEGNPLFIVAVLRKMVDDSKIYQESGQWRIARLERNYFPRSLEEIIQQKKELLDEESRQFIDQASAFGESMSLSMLAGFSKEHSAKIYDYLNQAQEKGLVRSEFSDRDENIRFSGKQVREAIYQDIPEEIKAEIQARVGYYQEDLYKRGLLPSSAILAHHFSQSADMEKAQHYQQIQADYEERLFQPEEARHYAEPGRDSAEEAVAREPLSAEAMARVPLLLRCLMVAVRNNRLYPSESKSVRDALDQLYSVLQEILAHDERISIVSDKSTLLINQGAIDTTAFPRVAEALLHLWDRLELHHVTFIRGIKANELTVPVRKLGQTAGKSVYPGFWQEFRRSHPTPHLVIGQVRYKKLGEEAPEGSDKPAAARGAQRPSKYGAEAGLSEETLLSVQRIISSLLGAASKLKLYPSQGPVAQEAVSRLNGALQSYLTARPAITLARVENALLVNGVKMDVTGFETLAGSLIRFFSDTGIDSLTFLQGVSPEELTRFIAAAGSSEEQTIETPFWLEPEAAEQFVHVRVNEGLYGIREAAPGDSSSEREEETPDRPFPSGSAVLSPSAAESEAIDPADLPARIRDMFLTGNLAPARRILRGLKEKYRNSDPAGRKAVLQTFDSLLTPGDWKPNAAFLYFVIEPVMELMAEESDPELVSHAAATGYKGVREFVWFGEYSLAAWVMAGINEHPQSSRIERPALPAAVLETLAQALGASDTDLQQSAFQLISSVGELMLPHLINMIKRDHSLRSRRLAAELIRAQGPQAVTAVKRTLMNEPIPEDRARILDVIDTITTDIQLELYYALSDFKQVVRQAAGRLAERISSPPVIDMLIRAARGDATDTAITAVNILGRIQALDAADTLIELLDQAVDEELLVAVCRAMGQIRDASFVLPLQNILRSRRSLIFRKARPSQVRVAAAYAVSQINDPRCPRILSALADDADPHLREVVRNLTA
jgi:diguanylate cyclase (GGDEF)-like protein